MRWRRRTCSRSTAGRWIARRSCRRRSLAAYRDYQFHLIYQKVHNFCVNDLGALLPRRHQGPPVHLPGRQSAASLVPDGHVPHRRGTGALAGAGAELHRRRDLATSAGRARRYRSSSPPGTRACSAWRRRRGHRRGRLGERRWRCGPRSGRHLEQARKAGAIGAALDAEVDLYCEPALVREPVQAGRRAALSAHHLGGPAAPCGGGRRKRCRGRRVAGPEAPWSVPSDHAKCVRCWHHRPDVGADPRHPRAVRPLRGECRRVRARPAGSSDRQRHVALAVAVGRPCSQLDQVTKLWVRGRRCSPTRPGPLSRGFST